MRCSEPRRSFVGLPIAAVAIFILSAAMSAQAQTFTVLHAFTGRSDGGTPYGVGLTMDAAGNLYGGASYGGLANQACSYQGSCGVIYKLSHRGSGWVFNTLYEFTGNDGEQPDGPLVFGPDGVLYGTTFYGGSYSCIDGGCGVVYSLRPPPSHCQAVSCPWVVTVLHRFNGSDGARPAFGALVFDNSGNIYGTTSLGGQSPPYGGNVFELTRSGSQWSMNVLHSFTGQDDGYDPWSGLVFDTAGNLYGTHHRWGRLRRRHGFPDDSVGRYLDADYHPSLSGEHGRIERLLQPHPRSLPAICGAQPATVAQAAPELPSGCRRPGEGGR